MGRKSFRTLLVLATLQVPSLLRGQDQAALAGLETARRLRAQGSAQAASSEYELVIRLLRESKDRALLGRVLFETSQAALALGEYPRAIARAGAAAVIFHEQGDSRFEAGAINNIGLAHLYTGEYGEALENFQRALTLDLRRKDASSEITHLNNIGNVAFFQGKYLDALQSYEHALERCQETSAENWNPRRRQLTLTNLATLYEQLGQNERALDNYKLAQSSGKALPPGEYAQLLSNLGTLYRRMGDPVKALETYRSAQTLFTKNQHSDGEIHILQNIGIALALDYKDLSGALAAFSQALTLSEATSNRRQIVLALLFRGEALFRLNRLPEATLDFERGLEGAREIRAAEEQWTAQYGLARIYERRMQIGPALEAFEKAIASIESVRSELGQSSLKTDFFAGKRDVYDAYIDALLRIGSVDRERLFRIFEQARSRNLRDALRRPAAPLDILSVQEKLDDQSLMIEYWIGSGQMAAFWVTKKSAGVVNKPLEAEGIDTIRKLARDLAGASDSAWRIDAERAGRLLLSGIPAWKEMRHIIIVPDGVLHALPFELLVSEGSLLIERAAVSYLPSAALLSKRSPARRAVPPWSRSLLAFGDPAVLQRSALPMDERWKRLPDSATELRAIAAVSRGRAEIHAALADRKSRLIEGGAEGVPLLHFSTHAAVDTVDPNRSRILFTPEAGKKGSEYLFWREVQGLNLKGVDLVTLSACDTESGKLTPGEGIQSFSRAFLAAGAGATVTTLWRVADRPTAEFMARFYERLARGETKAEALRAAKLSFLRSGSELAQPRYWAAFVLNGDAQNPVRPVYSWWWIIGPGVAVLLTISALARWQRDTKAL